MPQQYEGGVFKPYKIPIPQSQLLTPDKSKLTPAPARSNMERPPMPGQDTFGVRGVRLSPLPPSGISTQNSAINSSAQTTVSSALQKSPLKASQITSGTMALANGGTGSNLTTSGGTGQVLQQTTPGGAVSAGLISFSSLTGTVAPSQIPTTLPQTTMPAITLTGATPTGAGTDVSLGNSVGFGNGSSGQAVVTTAQGTGGGPAAPRTIVNYLEIDIGGTKWWIPLTQ